MIPSHLIRPQGPLDWIIERLGLTGDWSAIGALSAEDRCLAAPLALGKHKACSIVRTTMLQLEPEELEANKRLDETRKRIDSHVIRANDFGFAVHESIPVLAADNAITLLAEELVERSNRNVLLDVSTMPKRFFFPLLAELCLSPHVENLLVANTAPAAYSRGPLSENAERWTSLPGFMSTASEEGFRTTLIIGVGYQLLNLKELLERYGRKRTEFKLMLPVPSMHPGFKNNWQFIHDIKTQLQTIALNGDRVGHSLDVVRIPNHDVSLAFDRLVQHSEQGQATSVVMAPFGPKPLSVAMCLLGIARQTQPDFETEIGYTQPRVYSPDYSSGIGGTTAYCIKLNGRNLYSL